MKERVKVTLGLPVNLDPLQRSVNTYHWFMHLDTDGCDADAVIHDP